MDSAAPLARASPRPRPRRPLSKHLQALLGPRVATLPNLLLLLLLIQALLILALLSSISAKNVLLAAHRIPPYAPPASDPRLQSDAPYGQPPPENDRPLPELPYDDEDPAITGCHPQTARWPAFLARPARRCRPAPCNIDHWAYIGEKCFYRDDHVKDRAGHNSSVWSLVDPQEWYYSLDFDFACPAVICRHQWREELNLTEHILLRVLQEHYQNDTPWNLENMYTGSKYIRVNHFWGLEYKLHGQFTLTRVDDNGEELQQNKTAAITIRRGFTQKYCDVSLNADVPAPEEPIYIVVPYTGRVEQLRLFYLNIKELLDAGVALKVILATHGGPVHMLGAVELLREMQLGISEGELTDNHVVQVIDAYGDRYGNFSRSRALMDGAQYVPADGLMFYCDVDMIIKKPFFDNCRYNTRRNYQVYYPVVYSLYPYGTKVSKEHGYWRKGAFGMVCGYKSDFKKTKTWRHSQRSLTGWGFEDVLLHKEFSNHWQISVFHAVEPNLMHRWHPKYCEFNMHVAACLGTIFQNMGSQQFLASIVAQKGIDVREIPYEPIPVIFRPYKNDTAGSKERVLEIPAPESATDETKIEEFRKIYEDGLREGKAGLISLFAKEAQETVLRATIEQKNQHNPSVPAVESVPKSVPQNQQFATSEQHADGSHQNDPSAPISPDHAPRAPLVPEAPLSEPAPKAPLVPEAPESDSTTTS